MLENNFGSRIISRGFANEWSSRSPDLTLCDFYLWSAVAESVYSNGAYSTVGEFQDAIRNAFNTLNNHLMKHVRAAVLSVSQRLQICIQINGSHLVHR